MTVSMFSRAGRATIFETPRYRDRPERPSVPKETPMTVPRAGAMQAPGLVDLQACERALRDGDDPLPSFSAAVHETSQALQDRFASGAPVEDLVRLRAHSIDDLLALAWGHFFAPSSAAIALVAVGGYGRAELHPASDIDLLVLRASDPDFAWKQSVERLIAFLWDIGLEVGHSVRTVSECVEEAAKDVTVATNLMEARLVCGKSSLFDEMRAATSSPRMWRSREFFEAKFAEQQRRHHKYHDTAYNLEPDIKDGPGGLRDIQMIGWVVKRHFGATTLYELVTHGFLTESEYACLIAGQNTLWRLRFALHLLTGRCEDRLLFDYQQTLAKQFGYEDEGHHLGVEMFMKSYYRTVKELDRLNEMLLALFQELIVFDAADTELVPINEHFQARNGFLEVVRDDLFSTNPLALLEVFLTLQEHPELQGVRAATIRLIRDNRHRIDERFRGDPAARALFMRILRKPRGVTHGLRRMHRYGVLAAYLPAFARIVGQMQYDLFHAYTVDEHSLFVVRNVRAFAVPEKQHEFPLCSEVFERLPHPELLYIAALFHDIAKGRGGDHSELGAEEAMTFCVDHGLSQYSTRLVAWLVRHHLLLSVTAQRRDISDPEVINEFASKVGDHVHLDYLYLLTVADIRGTNPKLWNDWKNALLRDLYESTLRALRRGLENPIDKAELIEDTQTSAREMLAGSGLAPEAVETLWCGLGDDYFLRDAPDEIAWHTQGIMGSNDTGEPLVLVRNGHRGTEIFVYAPDQEYLFAASTAVLDRLGLNIVDSRIITADNGMTLNSYVVLEPNAEPISGNARAEEIRTRLSAELKKPRPTPRKSARRGRRQLKHFSIPTVVSFDRDDANERTIMEVICADRPGLLSRIGWGLVRSGISVQNAKIATYGERAEDVFFITTGDKQPLDSEREEEVRRRIVEAVGD